MKPKRLSRLVYIAGKLGPSTPSLPRALRKYFPEFELIEAVKLGPEAASSLVNIDADQLRNLFTSGKKSGKASVEEFRTIIAAEITENDKVMELPMTKRLQVFGLVDRFVNNSDEGMMANSRRSLGDTSEVKPMEKWNSGFGPVDLVTGGLYQGLMVLVAKPGGGKTSTMLTLASELKAAHPEWKLYFYEMEIPENLMLSRMKPLLDQGNFTNDDALICGGMTVDDIVSDLEGTTRDKVVFIDSPDTMPGLSAENRRFELGYIYRQLVSIKGNSQLVVVASQPRRKDKGNFQIESLAESWEKSWLADLVLGVWPVGRNKYKIRSVKNRFGIFGQEVTYDFDLATLEWSDSTLDEEDW